jgi:hypothetical protein
MEIENPPINGDFNVNYKWWIFQQAMFDYQSVISSHLRCLTWICDIFRVIQQKNLLVPEKKFPVSPVFVDSSIIISSRIPGPQHPDVSATGIPGSGALRGDDENDGSFIDLL